MPQAIGLAIAAIFGATVAPATATAIGLAVIMTGANLVISAVAKAVIGKPKFADLSSDANTRQFTIRQPVSPWLVNYGEARVGGVIVYLALTGSSNEYLHFVIVHGSGEHEDVPAMYFDGQEVSFDEDGNALGGLVHWEKRTGSTDPAVQTAYAGLIADTAGLPAGQRYTDSRRGYGHCHSWVRLKWDRDKFPNGVPTMRFDVKGRKVYDPRTATKTYSNNFALCVRDYLADPNIGIGAPDAELDDVVNSAAANLSDEEVLLANGQTERRYTIDGAFSADKSPNEILPSLLAAGWGAVVYSSGKWGIYPAAWREPVMTLGDDDFLQPLKVETRVARRLAVNGVKGTYIAKGKDYQPDDFPAYYRGVDRGFSQDDYLLEDGERLWKDLTLSFTTSHARAQRIAKIVLEEARQPNTARVVSKVRAARLAVPDFCGLTHARFAWEAKNFKLAEWRLAQQANNGAPFFFVELAMRETSPLIYAWNALEELGTYEAGTRVLPSLGSAEAPTNLVLTSGDATALIRVDGIRISRIKATWTAPPDAFVISGGRIIVQYREAGTAPWLDAEPADGAATVAFIPGVNDGVAYDVRIAAVNSGGARSEWLQGGPHTVQGVAFPHGTYRPTSNPLTAVDAGTHPTVTIDAFVMRVAGVGDLNVNGGSIDATSGDYGQTAFIYYDDAAYAGGTVVYNLTFTREVSLSGPCRFFVGSIPLPVAGGPGARGNNDGGAGAQYARSARLLASSYTAVGWVAPDQGIDEDPENYSEGTASLANVSYEAFGFSGFSGWFSQLDLRILHEFTSSAGGWLEYSKDGGANWVLLRRVSEADAGRVDTLLGLPLTQKSELVRVRMTVPPHNVVVPSDYAGAGTDSAAFGTIAWDHPSYAAGGPDGNAAIATTVDEGSTHYLILSDFGLALPAGATILGIAVDVNRSGSYSPPDLDFAGLRVRDAAVYLTKGSGVVGANRANGSVVWPQDPVVASYGGSADLWGTTWSVAEVNDAGFGVVVAASLFSNGVTPCSATVNGVLVTVYYAAGAPGAAGSGRLYYVSQEVTI